MRAVWRRLTKIWAGFVIAALVPVLACRVSGFVIGAILRRRYSRRTFYRSLRKAGLSERDANRLTERYHAKITLRELLAYRSHHTS